MPKDRTEISSDIISSFAHKKRNILPLWFGTQSRNVVINIV